MMLHRADEQQTPLHLTNHLLTNNQGERTAGGNSDDCYRYFNVDMHTYLCICVFLHCLLSKNNSYSLNIEIAEAFTNFIQSSKNGFKQLIKPQN